MFRSGWGVLTFTKTKTNLIRASAISTPAEEFMQSGKSGNGQSPSLASGQEVIKQDQTPGTAHGPAI